MHYRFAAPAGTVTLRAELCYQSLSPRDADELFAWDTPEVKGFRTMYEAADRRPERLAVETLTVK